jgi:hypothetical protein
MLINRFFVGVQVIWASLGSLSQKLLFVQRFIKSRLLLLLKRFDYLIKRCTFFEVLGCFIQVYRRIFTKLCPQYHLSFPFFILGIVSN